MTLAFWTVTYAIKGLTSLLCKIESDQLQQVPLKGPLILVCNHINFLDAPVAYTHLLPRPLTGFAKAETWDSPFLGPLFSLWGAIPLQRGEADFSAMHKALEALEQGRIVAMAPEGTRSGNGRLRRGHPGIVTLALRSGAPLLPLVYFGGEAFQTNVRRLRRTDFHFCVGRPFSLDMQGGKVTRLVRQHIADEIMYQLAALLPEAYRGEYADLEAATQRYLRFSMPEPIKTQSGVRLNKVFE
jgi:1-acyl-sn-glycerol-3-phosphate acyltransferase